jgi:hypothetical protein
MQRGDFPLRAARAGRRVTFAKGPSGRLSCRIITSDGFRSPELCLDSRLLPDFAGFLREAIWRRVDQDVHQKWMS